MTKEKRKGFGPWGWPNHPHGPQGPKPLQFYFIFIFILFFFLVIGMAEPSTRFHFLLFFEKKKEIKI
jgi:hypothetical protein